MLSQQIRSSTAGSSSLLDSIDAVRNWRAVALLVASFIVAALVAAFGGALGAGLISRSSGAFAQGSSALLTFVFVLVAMAIAFYGVNATGMMMMDEASARPSRPVGTAVTTSLVTSHRLILTLLIIGIMYLVGSLAFALLLFVCRIPGIGPLLYTFVVPVGIVVSGIGLFAIPTVIFPLAAPAIWSGASTMEAVGQLVAVARKRLLLVLILMIVVGLVAWIVGALIGAILLSGTWFTGILSAAILGTSAGGLSDLGTVMLGSAIGSGGFGRGPGGYVMAGLMGAGMVWGVALTLPALVYLRGASSVYLRAIEGLDLAAEQAALHEKVAAAHARAKELQVQAQATAHQYAQRAQAPALTAASAGSLAPPAAAISAGTPGCPACGTAIISGDAFCANCGHRLA